MNKINRWRKAAAAKRIANRRSRACERLDEHLRRDIGLTPYGGRFDFFEGEKR